MPRLIVTETRNECEYNPERVLVAWRTLLPLIPADDHRGYSENGALDNEDRIVLLFELLDGSIFGDMIFSDLANPYVGHTLIERAEDA